LNTGDAIETIRKFDACAISRRAAISSSDMSTTFLFHAVRSSSAAREPRFAGNAWRRDRQLQAWRALPWHEDRHA
jgi:hypothetical protein